MDAWIQRTRVSDGDDPIDGKGAKYAHTMKKNKNAKRNFNRRSSVQSQ
jgi:hypothetical protein